MSRRHRIHAKRRRRGAATPAVRRASAPPSRAAASLIAPVSVTTPAIDPDAELEDGPVVDVDRLVPDAVLAASLETGLREPPALIVEGPEGAARRRARDLRDGVERADPKRGPLYVGIAVFVALLVFAVLSIIEMGEVAPPLPP
jgi:hypothetical protein